MKYAKHCNPENVTCELNSFIASLCSPEIHHLGDIRELSLLDALCRLLMQSHIPEFLMSFHLIFQPFWEQWLIETDVAIFWDTSKMVLHSWLIPSIGMVPVENHNLLLKGCILHFPIWFQRPISFCLRVGISHRNLGLDQHLFIICPCSSSASTRFDTTRHLHLCWFPANFGMSPPNFLDFLMTSLSAASISLRILSGVCALLRHPPPCLHQLCCLHCPTISHCHLTPSLFNWAWQQWHPCALSFDSVRAWVHFQGPSAALNPLRMLFRKTETQAWNFD